MSESAPVVFISYSHDSEEHREMVLRLSERLREDGFDAQIDRYVKGTPRQKWPRWMLDQIDAADFVVVVCTGTYYRRFRGHEDAGTGKGADWEGAVITQAIYDTKGQTVKFVPVILAPGQEAFIPEPLRGHTYYELTSEPRYQALLAYLQGAAGVEPRRLGKIRAVNRRVAEPLTFGRGPDQRIASTRLRHAADRLFGRDAELAALEEAWADPAVHVVTLVAWGGVGKTSLVSKWVAELARRDFEGADYFDWSFYSQGTREQGGASADPFVDAALRFFGDEVTADSTTSAWDKGSQLARLVAERRTLLVLDGLEPLQHPPGPLEGDLKDPSVSALLKGLAQRNAGLCAVTTRERVRDLAAFEQSTAPRWELERLSIPAGVELLKFLGVHGRADDLEGLVEEVRGHALSVSLLGCYLKAGHGGDVRQHDLVRFDEADAEIRGGHAFRVMEAYERWFVGEGESGERALAILHLLGLFDRPATGELMIALRRQPPILGLTDPIAELNESQWNLAVTRLADCGLVVRVGDVLDSHPLIREHFGTRLRERSPAAWRAAHGRLFDHLVSSTEYWPDTLEGLQPLYQAIVHGCQAGRYEEARAGVYRDRILRGTDNFSTFQLGAIGADLSAVACFFESPWSRVSGTLAESAQAWLLNDAAFSLGALGRLREAVEPMRTAVRMRIDQQNWGEAAISTNNLSELKLTLGDVAGAVRNAERAVDYADRNGDPFLRLAFRTMVGKALQHAGRREEALVRFREAEAMQAEQQPDYPFLWALQGFRFCDLLLAGAERAARGGPAGRGAKEACDHVERRVEGGQRAWREILRSTPSVLEVALDHLAIGRARLYRTILGGFSSDTAEPEIDQAVDGLRHAGQLDYLPTGLHTRAWLRATQGRRDEARADLAEAQEIAERGPMPLHLADVHLLRACLFHDRAALAEAKRLVKRHAYFRRREELADLDATAERW